MEDENRWRAVLLDKIKVEALRERGVKLNSMGDLDLRKLAVTEPLVVVAPSHYKAKKAFFAILQTQSWWSPDVAFTHIYPYIYVKNEVDGRFHQQPDLDPTFDAAKEQKVLVRSE